jgi:hypothetical protein
MREAAAAQQWSRLNDRFNLGEPLTGRMLDSVVAWRDETMPNAAWAKRYGGNYEPVIAYLNKSERAERNRRFARNAAIAVVFLALCAVAASFYYLWRQAQTEEAQAESTYNLAKNVLQNLTFDFAGNLGSGGSGQNQDMDVAEVTVAFQKATASLNELAKTKPNDTQLLAIQADILDRFIEGYRATDYKHQALDVANQADAVLRRLLRLQADSTTWQAKLSLNLQKIGDLKVALGDRDKPDPLAIYQDALSLDRALMQREPGHEDHSRQAAIELINIGDLQRQADSQGALASYQEALSIRKKLAALYPFIPIYQRDLSSALDRIADLQTDPQEQLATLQQKLQLDQQIVQLPFGTYQSDKKYIAADYSAIASAQEQMGDNPNALKNYQQALEIDDQLATRAPQDVTAQHRAAETAKLIGELQLKMGDVAGAKKSFAAALSTQLTAAEDARADYNMGNSDKKAEVVDEYGKISWYALLAQKPDQAAAYGRVAFRLDQSQIWIEVNVAHADLFLGKYEDAKAIYLKVKDLPHNKGTYADDIRADFETFRKLDILGTAAPDFDRMAKEIGI